jgi:hypothetical protein
MYLGCIYATIVAFLFGSSDSILALPHRLLSPFRIAGGGLFAVMTPVRYEIGSRAATMGDVDAVPVSL